jgi:hypothetical protein
VFFCLVCHQLAAQPVDLLDELVALTFGVQRVPGPAEQVPHRLQGLVGAVLDRGDDGQKAALDRMQTSTGSLAEVGREQYQGENDEHREHCSSPPNRLVIHVLRSSERSAQ